MKKLCTICARGGSKGIPGKNIKLLEGRPLVAHTVEQAVRSGQFSEIAISSDSEAIIEAAMSAGATIAVRRPADMASDNAGKLPAIAHCVLQAEAASGETFDIVVDLDATSPLRSIEDIHGAISMLETTGATSVITAAPARRSPYFNLVERSPDGVVRLSKPGQGILRRQDSPPCFDMNASIYVWRRDPFVADPAVFYDDTRLFEMPEERSHDIDTALDFEWVSFLMRRGSNG